LILDGAVELAIGAYACAVLTINYEGAVLPIPNAAIPAIAILWQRFGRALATIESLETAALCAGISARLFKRAGRIDGEIRSELDALHTLAQVGPTSNVVTNATDRSSIPFRLDPYPEEDLPRVPNRFRPVLRCGFENCNLKCNKEADFQAENFKRIVFLKEGGLL
jgi:hypothetical protein